MTKVAVVILNWNTESILREFLPNVVMHTPMADHQIYLIDNGSTDGSLPYVQSEFPELSIIPLDKNYGFTGGYQRGLESIEADYFILLNSDVAVSPQWTIPMLERMQKNPKIAACQPKILSYKEPSFFEYAGAAGGFIDYLGYPFCRGRIFNQVEKDEGQYNEAGPIFWASGAALMVRSDVYKKLGGLDENFFAHMEEIDLCWRFHNAGYEVWYEPQSVVYHLGGGTLPNESPRKIYLNFRNNLYLLHKNLPKKGLRSLIFRRKLFDGLAAIQFLLRFKFDFVWSIVRAHRDYKKHIPELERQRKNSTIDKESLHYPAGVYHESIVLAFFLKGKKHYRELNLDSIS